MKPNRPIAIMALLAVGGVAYLLLEEEDRVYPSDCAATHAPPAQVHSICPSGSAFTGSEGIVVLLNAIDGVESCSAALVGDTLRVAVHGYLDDPDPPRPQIPSMFLELQGVSSLQATRTLKDHSDAPADPLGLLNERATFLIGGDVMADGRLLLMLDEADQQSPQMGGNMYFYAKQGCLVDTQGQALSPTEAFALLHRREAAL